MSSSIYRSVEQNYGYGKQTRSGDPSAVYGYKQAAPEKVHHTLPIANVTACGLACVPFAASAPMSSASVRFTYDFSNVTCEECRKRLTTSVTDAETAKAVEDAGWLRTQGEDFGSLRALVLAVNVGEGDLCGDDPPFGSKTRAEFVARVCSDLATAQAKKSGAYDPTDEDLTAAPPGGLCHDDASDLVYAVRRSVRTLREAQAWPDDARRVAQILEDTLEALKLLKKP